MNKYRKISAGLLALVLLFAGFWFLPSVFAGTLTNVSVLELGGASGATPMIANTAQSIAFEFTPASAAASPTTTLTFTGWIGGAAGSVNTTQTAATNSCTTLFPGSPTALPGTLVASGSGAVVTITGGTSISNGTTYCSELTSASAVTNPTAAGSYSVVVSDGTDSQTATIGVLTAGTNAFTVGASVGSTFTLSLNGATTDNFTGYPTTPLSASAVTVTGGVITTVSTNARTGWFVWAKDSNAGLTSTSASHTIPTVSTGSNHTMNGGTVGTEAYAFGAVTGTGSPTIPGSYAYGGGTTGGGLSTSVYNQIASNNAASNGNTFTTHELADISNTTPPASDYTDTITEIGAGSF